MSIRELSVEEVQAVSGAGLLSCFGVVSMNLHWTAESLISALGLQPIFSLIDKPLIHPILWTPLAQLTGVPVDSHPAGI